MSENIEIINPAVTEKSDYVFYAEATHDNINQGTIAIEEAKARADAQNKLLLAMSHPRDEARALSRMLDVCKRPNFARKAFYSYNKGTGSTVKGLSIRAAEEMARLWGNLEYGLKELSQDKGKSEMQAYCWDLETNTMSAQTFTNKHARDVKGTVKELTSLRDIYEINANMGARRMRARILAIIPDYIVDEVIEECNKTLRGNNDVPLADRANAMVKQFKKIGVTIEMIEKRLGKSVSQMTPDDFDEYIGIYNSIVDKMQTIDDWFSFGSELKSDIGSSLDKLDE